MVMNEQAVNGTVRTIRGEKFNTADVVNQALTGLSADDMDTESARQVLVKLGLPCPDEMTVLRYAYESAVLGRIARAVNNEAVLRQIGRWDMRSAQTILASLDAYLWRRVAGQRADWGKSH